MGHVQVWQFVFYAKLGLRDTMPVQSHWCFLVEKLIVIKLVKRFAACMEPDENYRLPKISH
jgi:hypothetical protein